MSELIPVTPVNQATAQGLLAAADALGLDQSVVQGPFAREPKGFRVPSEVAEKFLEMQSAGESLDTDADTDGADEDDHDKDVPEGVFVEVADTDPEYDPAYDGGIKYADLDPADKAKRTRKINEVKAAAEAGTQE